MCEVWTAEEWVTSSQPAKITSPYTLKDTRYNQGGEAARTYRTLTGSFYGVLPGRDNDELFMYYLDNPRSYALDYLAENGFDLIEKTTPVAEVIAEVEASIPEPLGLADLVQNFS